MNDSDYIVVFTLMLVTVAMGILSIITEWPVYLQILCILAVGLNSFCAGLYIGSMGDY